MQYLTRVTYMFDVNYNELDYTCGLSDDELSRRFKETVRIENLTKITFST